MRVVCMCVVCSEAKVQSEASQHNRLRGSLAHDALCRYWSSFTNCALGQEQPSWCARPS